MNDRTMTSDFKTIRKSHRRKKYYSTILGLSYSKNMANFENILLVYFIKNKPFVREELYCLHSYRYLSVL